MAIVYNLDIIIIPGWDPLETLADLDLEFAENPCPNNIPLAQVLSGIARKQQKSNIQDSIGPNIGAVVLQKTRNIGSHFPRCWNNEKQTEWSSETPRPPRNNDIYIKLRNVSIPERNP